MKNWLISLAAGVLVCLAGMVINYRHYVRFGLLTWAVHHFGGEITVQYGFGWQTVVTYGMTPEEATVRTLSFDPVGFVISVLLCTVVIYAAWKVIGFVIHTVNKTK